MKHFTFGLLAVLLLLCGSCSMNKNIPYFQPLDAKGELVAVAQHESRICKDDMLAITVSGLDPLAVAPFNLPIVAYAEPGSENINAQRSYQPYLVDVHGNINFPVGGKIHLAGLTKSQAIDSLTAKLAPYLKDPIITIQFMNYKVTILGEVLRPGSYTIKNERVTLLEALGLAGDLTVYGKRTNVLPIRQLLNGEKEYLRINLNDTELLTSHYYYLQQNDVIYVEPNKTKVSAAASTNVSLYLSVISTLASMVTVIVAVINLK